MSKMSFSSPISFTEDFYRKILDRVGTGIYVTDKERKIHYWSKGAESLTGFSAEEILGKSCSDGFLVHIDENGIPLCNKDCPLSLCIRHQKTHTTDFYMRHKDGHRVPVRAEVFPFFNDTGEFTGAVQLFQDLTQISRMVEEISDLNKKAHIDQLTGIYNRRYLNNVLQNAWHQHFAYAHKFALLFTDFNKLKKINDTYGHLVGDRALVAVVDALTKSIRGADLIGRWGGDEFLILLQPANREVIKLVVDKLTQKIDDLDFVVDGQKVKLGITIGYAFPDQAKSLFELISLADEDMYEKKEKYFQEAAE